MDSGYNFLGQRLFHLIAKFKNIKSFKQSLSLPYSSNMYKKNKKQMFESDDDYDENVGLQLLQQCTVINKKKNPLVLLVISTIILLFSSHKIIWPKIRLKKASKAKSTKKAKKAKKDKNKDEKLYSLPLNWVKNEKLIQNFIWPLSKSTILLKLTIPRWMYKKINIFLHYENISNFPYSPYILRSIKVIEKNLIFDQN